MEVCILLNEADKVKQLTSRTARMKVDGLAYFQTFTKTGREES